MQAMRICSQAGCDRPHSGLGYCSMHLRRFKTRGSADDGPGHRGFETSCVVEGCERRASYFTYCSMHYRRVQKHGDPTADGRRKKRTQFDCSVEGCDTPARARHMCLRHYARWQTHGDPLVNLKDKSPFRATLDWRKVEDVFKLPGTPSTGYRVTNWPEHPNANRAGTVGQHIAVMAAVLGRPMHKGETVHHKNGVRHDNRPENLEVWTRRHAPGQRVTDLLAWAHALIEEYADDPQLWPEGLMP